MRGRSGLPWTPSTWRAYPADQQPPWEDVEELRGVIAELRELPPLIFADETRALKASLAAASRGEAFVLQAGDCAEAFGEFSPEALRDRLRLMLQMGVVVSYAVGRPVVKIGRIAGQFAKPRSADLESRDGRTLPSFRGHAVNDLPFDSAARRPDPTRLVRAYNHAVARMNLIRALTQDGFADLSQLQSWNREFIAVSPCERFIRLVDQIERSLRFVTACGIDLAGEPRPREVDFYIAHEALILDFEEALTRREGRTSDWYCCSAHFLWLGERTRRLDGAHVAFLSGIKNPVGVKLGPEATPEDALELCARLDPDREPGRLSFITRMGAVRLRECLPALVRAVEESGHEVVWICDPMHGNTVTTADGLKTRRFADIVAEVRAFFEIHAQEGTVPGGIHLELTHEDVTECVEDGEDLAGAALPRYTTLCDPRLNGRQALELAFELGAMLESRHLRAVSAVG